MKTSTKKAKLLINIIKIFALHYYYKHKNITPINFLHIGKTGGTSIKFALYPYRRFKNYIFFFHPHEIKLKFIPRGGKIIFFLRDPVSRFVSAFNSRKRMGMPRYYFPWNHDEKIAFENFNNANELAISLSKKNKKYQKAICAMKSIQHVKDSYWDWFEDKIYFKSRLEDIIFWGFQESLNQGFEEVKQLFSLPINLKLPVDDINAHRSPEDAAVILNEQAIENLKIWYFKDYKFITMCEEILQLRK